MYRGPDHCWHLHFFNKSIVSESQCIKLVWFACIYPASYITTCWALSGRLARDWRKSSHSHIDTNSNILIYLGSLFQILSLSILCDKYKDMDFAKTQPSKTNWDNCSEQNITSPFPVLDLVSLYAVKTDSGKVSCTLCEYITRDKYNIRLHLEGKHGLSGGYQCDKCYKQLRTKQSLTQHRLHCILSTS